MNISLVVCTYNNSASLRRTLESMTRLAVPSGRTWEIIVVDNNSSDNTRQVAEDFLGRLPLRYVFEAEQGLAIARRRGVRESSSELIGMVDDDCVVAPDWIEQAVRFCEHHPNAGAVGGKIRPVYEVEPPDFLLRNPCMSAQDLGEVPRRMPGSGYTNLVGAGLLLRRSSLEASGWMQRHFLIDHRGNSLTTGGDTEMILRIRAAGYELWYNPAMKLDHCIPSRRMSLQYVCKNYRGCGQAYTIVLAMGKWQPQSPWRVIRNNLEELMRCTAQCGRDLCRKARISPDVLIRLYTALGRIEGAASLIWHDELRRALARELARRPKSHLPEANGREHAPDRISTGRAERYPVKRELRSGVSRCS
jgi:GT2 family glycosyltransferase